MARAIWTGLISFGLVAIPVRLHTAVRDHALHFHYLHKDDGGRIRYERVCASCGKKVDWNDIVRGYEHEKDSYVVLSEEDFKRASPEASQTVDIIEFVNAAEIEPIFFDVPYYLEPERKGRHAYSLLREALRRAGKVGIARVVLRTREHLAALKPVGDALVVETMHWPDEVLEAGELDLPKPEKLPANEMNMATHLIETMTTPFEPGELKDRYRDQLLAFIEARAQGRARAGARAGKAKSPTQVVDLVRVLEQSIAAHGKREPAKAKPARSGRRSRRAA